MAAKNPLVLVDGSSYLYRAFHALPPLTTASGQPTGAVKGVINMLRRLQKDYPGSTIAVIFDAKGKTFRDRIFAEYKANRPPMPDELRTQVQPIHDIVNAMGLPLLVVDDVEADDVIGTLAREASAALLPVVVSTGDKDMAQLVDDSVTLVNTMTSTVLNVDGVVEKFGIPPERIIDFLALMGDKVDNIPGVRGVGEKTALALVQNLGGVDDIYRSLDKVPELEIRGAKSLASKLEAAEDDARLSHELATIKCDLDLDFAATDLASGEYNKAPDNERLLDLFVELEFKTWVNEVKSGAFEKATSSAGEKLKTGNGKKPGQASAAAQPKAATQAKGAAGETEQADEQAHQQVKGNYETITAKKSLQTWLKKLRGAKRFAFDTETTSLDYEQARVVGVSFAVEPGSAAYLPFGHDYEGAPQQLDETTVLDALRPLLEDAAFEKIGQNLKYDKHVMANHGVSLEGIGDDTMLMSYVLNSTASRHDMDTLALAHLGYSTIHYEDIAGKGAKQIGFNEVALEVAAPYAAEDADITLRLQQVLAAKLEQEPALLKLYRDIELPLLDVICSIEANGALIDVDLLNQQSAELGKRLEEIETEAHELAGEEFNLGSPKQLQAILFDKLGLPVIKKTPKGQPSTAEPILQELALDYPLPKILMQYRTLSKLKSTYTDRLPEQVAERTGRVHTSYHQAVTATGRLSSTDPNLQHIPIRTEEGRRVRKAFIAPDGAKILAADYSQIELRIMAHLSGDKGLLKAFNEGKDVHRATAAEVFGVGIAEVSDEQRRRAKAINFGLIYGMSAFGLARQLDIARGDAQQYIERYFERYPGVRIYMDETRALAAEKGYVETLFKRRLYLPEINARNGMRRQAAERTAINAPMQGTAADIIKIAMLRIHAWLRDAKLETKMIMQVHDELVFEVPQGELDSVSEQVSALMSSSAELAVPLIVDVGVGDNWEEAH
ncbi:MAG: DNA polymerase I [Gammaproteobacteria bacterium]|nr:DNA polymerase I [Gammaproteobacteria bacterium]